MTCESATNLISCRIDGEISAADQSALDEHLSTCPACRATMDVLSAQDSDLTRAFAPRRNAASAVADAAAVRGDDAQMRTRLERVARLAPPRPWGNVMGIATLIERVRTRAKGGGTIIYPMINSLPLSSVIRA